MVEKTKREYVGWAWIPVGNYTQKKPIYSKRKINRGKNKGKLWVTFLDGVIAEGVNRGKFRYKKVMILENDLIEFV